ncbi:A/G-specific adenine glycosylase [Bifidobacterium sp.]|jgi:A/G-specific adenine glycosylase|uniref:A/G-specific adenine glycosylase n=1 Tax=Bifidobacterium sp. TaxID=41200 RepID=UPI0025B90178|nr:A/G-specific adenine glycosylase [Bifidobacterium sp.]MCH4208840.1 A/G-specific adenine glycosylase [Bifidobacterium sp.]MCI1225448.1 A/G-specific adenine glycosylase [Bifidobacterium sp.]
MASVDVVDSGQQRTQNDLFAWWDQNARDLPWRFGRATPWGVLVSEVMSQQTQMSRVVPYWLAWMAVWPDAASLAHADTAEVITAWGRLGYPRRALRLQECARVVAQRYGNELPHAYEELLALPGIGDYTASAVMSFAFGGRIAVIDTNIRRVLSRVFLGIESHGGASTKPERELAERVLPRDVRASKTWNQSVMELGAIVCTAKNPLCEQCPLAGSCAFLAAGRPGLGERRTRPRQRFQGTNRQVRGLVLNALRNLGAEEPPQNTEDKDAGEPGKTTGKTSVTTLSRDQVEALWNDHVQLDLCIASLDEDGLIEILPDRSLRLPQRFNGAASQ